MSKLRNALLLCVLAWASPAYAASPSPTCTGQQFSSVVTDHDVTLPATVNSGDLLMVFIGIYGGNQSTASTATSGWVELDETNDSNRIKFAVYYKFADGTEDGGTMTITTTVGFRAMAHTCRITGAHASTAPEKGTAATSAGTPSTTPNPPTVTASWGAEDNLFIASYALQNASTGASAYPSSYVLVNASDDCGNVANCAGNGIAGLGLTADATDDPGTFTTESEDWVAQTVVIRAAAAASSPCMLGLLGVGCE